jgi:hypothetical protein
MSKKATYAKISLPQWQIKALLRLYDVPHPEKPGRVIQGYDKAHALRTAHMCSAVAQALEAPSQKIPQYEVACLLHDLGRAGLDQKLFGKIWSWARSKNIPTRPGEWRKKHPATPYGRETEAFLTKYAARLATEGIPMNAWAAEQVEMRLGYARRLRRQSRSRQSEIKKLGIPWTPWMEKIMLYYYYPEKLDTSAKWIKRFAEILVACEQLEAYSNRQRGQDYYTRTKESFGEAFQYLDQLYKRKIVSLPVRNAIRALTAQGCFDRILQAACGRALSIKEQRFLHTLTIS